MSTEGKEPGGPLQPEPTAGGERPERDYFAGIERRFQELRGSPILVSPQDWVRIASWRERGIPKEVALGGIEEAFRRKRERGSGSAVRSLAYCEPFVVEIWERHRAESVTRREAHAQQGERIWSAETVRAHLLRARETLFQAIESVGSRRSPLEDCLRSCVARLEREAVSVPSDTTPEGVQALERRLLTMEQELAAAARAGMSPEEEKRIQVEVERDLSGYRDMMSVTTYRETRQVLSEDRIRRVHSLPRLTLFYLS